MIRPADTARTEPTGDLPPTLRLLGDRLYARRLERQGRSIEAATTLRVRAEAGDESAAAALATLPATVGGADRPAADPETEVAVLRDRAGAGDGHADWELARLLVQQGLAELRTTARGVTHR
jgi:hypothetical protein